MRLSIIGCLCVAMINVGAWSDAFAQHRLILQGNGKLVILAEDGSTEWEMEWGGIHDVHVVDSGNIMVQRGLREVVEIDRATKEVVWRYDASTQNGNEGKGVEVHAFQPLENGNVMIAETVTRRIIEVDRDGKLVRSTPMQVDHPHPHTDTRLVRQIYGGNYLVCHEADGTVREYEPESGEVVWEYEIPLFDQSPAPGHGLDSFGNKVFAAIRMPSGNTLIATGNGHSVLEVTPSGEIAWQLHQDDLRGIRLGWVTTLELLDNGNLVIGNCHAGPDNPLLVEIERESKRVVWTLDRFEDFGNSVSNSQILDEGSKSIR